MLQSMGPETCISLPYLKCPCHFPTIKHHDKVSSYLPQIELVAVQLLLQWYVEGVHPQPYVRVAAGVPYTHQESSNFFLIVLVLPLVAMGVVYLLEAI